MDDLLIALDSQHAELAELVDSCKPDDWERATRCEGWDVASVLLHLAQTDEYATASAGGDLDGYRDGLLGTREQQTISVDDAAAAQVAFDRAAGGDEIRRRWHEASRTMRAALAAGDPHRRVTWVSGKLSLIPSRRPDSRSVGSTPATSHPRSMSIFHRPTGCATSRVSHGERSRTPSTGVTPRCTVPSRSS